MILDLLRPTVETPFAIDWDWFKKHGIDAQLAVRSQLCQQCRREFDQGAPIEEVDWVDPNSGEVFRVDSLREHIMAHCQWKPDYITTATPLATGIFRALLANNNRPLSPVQLAQRLGRSDPETILRVLTRGETKNGVVPVAEAD